MGTGGRLLIVRHGESTANRDRLVLGRSLAVPLTETGREQAKQAAERVAGLVTGPAALFSSDATRAQQTAQLIAARLAVPVTLSELLREQYLGELEGRPVSKLQPLPVPDGYDITEIGWGGGESVAQVYDRLRRFIDELADRNDLPATIVLVGHGDALCVLQALLAGRSHREIDWDNDALGLAEVRELRLRPRV